MGLPLPPAWSSRRGEISEAQSAMSCGPKRGWIGFAAARPAEVWQAAAAHARSWRRWRSSPSGRCAGAAWICGLWHKPWGSSASAAQRRYLSQPHRITFKRI